MNSVETFRVGGSPTRRRYLVFGIIIKGYVPHSILVAFANDGAVELHSHRVGTADRPTSDNRIVGMATWILHFKSQILREWDRDLVKREERFEVRFVEKLVRIQAKRDRDDAI